MNMDFAFICDYAEASGKINALGIGFDTIYARAVPAIHNLFFLVFQLRATVTEAGEKNIVVSMIDEDGRGVIPPLNARITVPRPTAGTESTARVAMAFNGVQFERYGSYSLHVVVDGHLMVRVPLKVSQPPQSA